MALFGRGAPSPVPLMQMARGFLLSLYQISPSQSRVELCTPFNQGFSAGRLSILVGALFSSARHKKMPSLSGWDGAQLLQGSPWFHKPDRWNYLFI